MTAVCLAFLYRFGRRDLTFNAPFLYRSIYRNILHALTISGGASEQVKVLVSSNGLLWISTSNGSVAAPHSVYSNHPIHLPWLNRRHVVIQSVAFSSVPFFFIFYVEISQEKRILPLVPLLILETRKPEKIRKVTIQYKILKTF